MTYIILTYQGKVETKDFNLGGLLKRGNPFGDVSFALDIDGRKQRGFQPRGIINGNISSFDLKGYNYKNLSLSGLFRGSSFDGSVLLDDPNGRLAIDGKIDSDDQYSIFNFRAEAKDISLDKLKLAPKLNNPALSFILDANFVGNKADNANGEIHIDSLTFINNEEQFRLNNMIIRASNQIGRAYV